MHRQFGTHGGCVAFFLQEEIPESGGKSGVYGAGGYAVAVVPLHETQELPVAAPRVEAQAFLGLGTDHVEEIGGLLRDVCPARQER